jgi:hypothetical protein
MKHGAVSSTDHGGGKRRGDLASGSLADQAALRAQQRIDAAEATQKLAESVSRAERDLEDQEVKAGNAREAAAQSMAKLTVAEEQLRTFSYSSKLHFRRSVCAVN